MALMVTDGLFQAVTGWDFLRHYNKVHGIQASFANRIAFGAWLVVMIPIALSFTCADKKQIPHKAVKGIICVVAVMLVLCLVLALSRGALIGFAFAMMFFVMARSKKIFLIGTILILVASVLGAAYFISVNADGNKFFMQFTKIRSWDGLLSFIKDLSAFMRWQVAPFPTETNSIRVGLTWEALLITNRYPIFGCGLNTYSVVARACPGVVIGTYPHNSYLQMAAETGLVGLASFMLFVSAFFVYSIKRVRSVSDVFVKNLSLGLLSGLAGFLVHSFFDVHLYSLQLSILMWYIMGLVMAVQNTALNEQYA
jgi:O-antigen ligase